MAKRQRGWTTLTDIEEFKTITWSFLKNITMTWEYDGMAFLFREARIPIYGIDRGTMKMNHPIMAMGIPMQRDKNYGVDIYVPAKLKKKAASLLADEARVRECAELEIVAGEENARTFDLPGRLSAVWYRFGGATPTVYRTRFRSTDVGRWLRRGWPDHFGVHDFLRRPVAGVGHVGR